MLLSQVGALIHYWRFSASHEEAQVLTAQQNRTVCDLSYHAPNPVFKYGWLGSCLTRLESSTKRFEHHFIYGWVCFVFLKLFSTYTLVIVNSRPNFLAYIFIYLYICIYLFIYLFIYI